MKARPFVALFGVLAVFGVVAWGLFSRVLPSSEPPQVERTEPAAPALTRHLLLIVVDGLRWDVATDAERMPNLARALRDHAGGELWAGRVSMTTSAVLTMITGERGGFEQVVFNADPSPPRFDGWLASAKLAKLTVMHVGDPAWTKMFGAFIDERRLDPEGVAIDVDFNPQTFRDARELRARRPNVLVVHFVTPDHQAHAHTIPSPRFAEHIKGFDRDLQAFLDETGPEWTVVVAGDHGAADSGTHGADVPIQRRTAIYAKGPGIVKGARTEGRIDQADLAGTFAALLGLPPPAHSRGHLLTGWLDVSDEVRRTLACRDAQRAVRLARANELSEILARTEPLARACESQPPHEALASARRILADVDRGIEARSGLASPIVVPLLVVATLLGVLTVLGVLGGKALIGALIALVAGAIAVALTWGVERLPGMQPHAVRIALFTAGNLVALALVAIPGRVTGLAERFPSVAPAVIPGLLVATYTTNAQPEAFVAIVVGALLLALLGGLSRSRPTLRASKLVLRPHELAIGIAAVAVLFLPGTRTSDVVPDWLRRDGTPSLLVGGALLVITAFALAQGDRDRRRFAIAAAGALLAVLALALRRVIPAWPGRAAIVVGLVLSAAFALRHARLPALLAGLFTYGWISRDFEIVTLAACLLVADVAGVGLSRHRDEPGAKLGFAELLLIVTFLFGLAFVLRIGLQGAIDFGSMDWGAAGFGDPHVPAWVIGSALGLKYALALALVLGTFAARLPRAATEQLFAACFVAFLARGVVLTAMFLIAGSSFWTGLRVLGDLPFGFLFATTVALMWIGLAARVHLLTNTRC